MHYYQHNIGDYRRDTGHLSLLEHGVYRQLLDMYYLSEDKIPEETEVVYRRLSARTEDEKRAVDTVLSEFFRRDSGWVHTRCDKEITEYQGKADRARNNGKLGGRPSRTKVVVSGNQDETQTKANQETNKPMNQEPIVKAPTSGAKTPRASRLSQDWVLPKAWGQWAVDTFPDWSADFIRLQADKFRDFWIARAGKDGAKLDWFATWRNWCRNTKDVCKDAQQNKPDPFAGAI